MVSPRSGWSAASCRLAPIGNALASAAQFDLGEEDARAIAKALATKVYAGWQQQFAEGGLGPADQARFPTCFRQADPEVNGADLGT